MKKLIITILASVLMTGTALAAGQAPVRKGEPVVVHKSVPVVVRHRVAPVWHCDHFLFLRHCYAGRRW